jgi:alpha,alpha-trehalase
VASDGQAARLVEHLQRFEHPWGLSHTDRQYPSPHPEFTWVQWGYPAGWAPIHLIVVQGLDRYGYRREAVRVARSYLSLIIAEFHRTGKLWERYNVVEGSSALPRERTPNIPMHGWTSAAVAWLGRRVFGSPDAALAEGL